MKSKQEQSSAFVNVHQVGLTAIIITFILHNLVTWRWRWARDQNTVNRS